MGNVREGLIRALAEAVRPFVRRLLSQGVAFGQVEGALRALFVEVAEQELASAGERPSESRIALLTGINRKEVKRLRGERGEDAPASFRMNLMTSVVSRWLNDRRATDASGKPRPLAYHARRGPSFTGICREISKDLAPRVVLDGLLRAGAARLDESDRVELLTDSFVPREGDPEKLGILAEDPAEMIDTMLRNVLGEGEALLQRKVYFDNVGDDARRKVRAEMRREGERFLRRIHQRLSRYDRDRTPGAPGGERYTAGLGVYFYENGKPASGEPPPRPARKRIRSREKNR